MSLAKSWFDHTFSSRQKAEQLLRPDLDSGLLTQHDFDLAVRFLPGYHRYLPYVQTVVWGGASGALLYRFRPKVRFPSVIVGVSALTGYGFGLFQYFRQHTKFARQLEDREAFLVALDNVNKRLGNRAPLFPQLDTSKMLENVMKRKQENGEVLTAGVEIVGDVNDLTDTTNDMPPLPRVPSQVSEEASSRPKSTWDAIREANARNKGKQSSWDELRQHHERQRVPADRAPAEPAEIEDPRAKAQAEFDAILEAERKAARG